MATKHDTPGTTGAGIAETLKSSAGNAADTLKTTANNAVDAASSTIDSLKTSASVAGADISAAGSDLLEMTRQAVTEMRRIADEYASRTSDRAGEAVGVIAEDARALGRDGFDALADTIAKRPVASLVFAAGVGLVLGWATRGGSRA